MTILHENRGYNSDVMETSYWLITLRFNMLVLSGIWVPRGCGILKVHLR